MHQAVEEDPQVVSIRQIEGNATCADCARKSPEWVSISLGTTICSECSGAHRSLGVQISKVKSLALDQLEPSTLELLTLTGNAFTNSLWEAAGVPAGEKPGASGTREARAEYVAKKYKARAFVRSELKAEMSENKDLLAQAAAAGDVRAMARCLVGGASVNDAVAPCHATDGKTVLMAAIESGSLPTIELCLNNSPDLEATNAAGQTALHVAVQLHTLHIRLRLARVPSCPSCLLAYLTPPFQSCSHMPMHGRCKMRLPWVCSSNVAPGRASAQRTALVPHQGPWWKLY